MFHKKAVSTDVSSADTTAKPKKKFYKKWWFWLIVLICIGAAGSSGGDEPQDTPSQNESDVEENKPSATGPEVEKAPDMEFANDSERFIWEIVNDNQGELSSIASTESSDGLLITGAIKCENDESVVTAILNSIAEKIKNSEISEGAVLIFADINDKDELALVSGAIQTDGSISLSELSNAYNSAHNIWIREQFSAWDGSHRELTKLIKSNLNDEKSYDHISTGYRVIKTEADKEEVNRVLADSGYSQRVEIDDLFIQTEFSAKNAFNATIKNTAFGIASYTNNTITLIDIG